MNILVTGATGFIGKHLVKKLIEQNHNVYCTLLPNEESPFDLRVQGTVIEPDNLKKMIEFCVNRNIDGIIHLASIFLTSHQYQDVPNLIDSNVKFGATVIECAAQAKVKWFINTGTFWQNYENAQYAPVNLYAATKQAFEDIAKYYIVTNKLVFVTIRLNDTFGSNDSRKKIFAIWDQISRTGELIQMSEGKQIIDISYIEDVVSAFLHLADLLNNNQLKNGDVYALHATERYTLRDLAEIFEDATGRKLNIEWGKRPYKEREVMEPWSEGRIIPNWTPQYSLKDAIMRSYK